MPYYNNYPYNLYNPYGGMQSNYYGTGLNQNPNFMPQQNNNNGMSQLPKTNKIFVTSVEDALARSQEPNSDLVYLHQDQPLLIEVYTDLQGKKTPQLFDITPHKTQEEKNTYDGKYVTTEEFNGVKGEINSLKEKLEKLSKGANKDEQSVE